MKCRTVLLTVSVVLTFILMIFAPVSEGASVNTVTCGDVTVSVIEDSIEMRTSETGHLPIHLCNEGTDAVTVRISSPSGSVIKASTDSDIILSPGTTTDTTCNLSTDRFTDKGIHDLRIIISVLDGDTETSASMDLKINVISQYSTGEQYNKFLGHYENDLSSPFNEPWFTALVTFLFWLIVSLAIGYISVKVIRFCLKIFKFNDSYIGTYTLYGIGLCILVHGILKTLTVFGLRGDVIAGLSEICDYIYVIFGAMIAWDLYKTLVYNVLEKSSQRSGPDESLAPLFLLIGKVLIVTISVAIILSIYGLTLTGVIAGAGIAGLGISLGIKPALSQLFAGISVMLTRPFKTGDMVQVGSNEALIVCKVGILYTEMRSDYTKEVIRMPNSTISSSSITNLTYRTRYYRKLLQIKMPFDTDQNLARRLMNEAAEENPNVINDGRTPKPMTTIEQYTDKSYILMRLAFYVNDYANGGSTAGRIREAVLKKFYENGIKVPMDKYEFTILNEKKVSE